MDERLFWAILVFILGCIVINLKQKLKACRNLIQDTSNDLFLERWDKEFKEIVAAYGSGEKFIDAHLADYNIYRSNVLMFIARLEQLADNINTSMQYLEKEFSEKSNTAVLAIKLDAMRSSMVSAVKDLAVSTEAFVKDEESAHSQERNVRKILDKLKKEIADINFYDEKKN